MPKAQSLIDFAELVSAVPGEGLEELVRQIGRRKGLSPSWSGRGSDSGRDLYFTETLSGSLSKEKITWLVSCKDKAKSNESVSERDLPAPGIKDKLAQHDANGFLLVTTTTVSSGAKALLDSLDKSNGGDIHTLVWDSSELTAILLDPTNHDLVKQFLPKSYQRVKGLTSLESSILGFRDQLPDEVLADVMRLIKPYSSSSLKGSLVWPFDSTSAATIDRIIKMLLIHQNAEEAALSTDKIEYDAFVALIERLYADYPDECFSYLSSIILKHDDEDMKYNAYQFLLDNYNLSRRDIVRLVLFVDDWPELIDKTEVSNFVQDILSESSQSHKALKELKITFSDISISDVTIKYVYFDATQCDQIDFVGEATMHGIFTYQKDGTKKQSISGTFSGYFNESDICLEEFTINPESETP